MFRPAPSPETMFWGVSGPSSSSRPALSPQTAGARSGFLTRVLIEAPGANIQDAALQRSSRLTPRKEAGNSNRSDDSQQLTHRCDPSRQSQSLLLTKSTARSALPLEQADATCGFFSRILSQAPGENRHDASPQRSGSLTPWKELEDSHCLAALFTDQGTQPPMSRPSSYSFGLAKLTQKDCQEFRASTLEIRKDDCKEGGAYTEELTGEDWFIPRILRPDSDLLKPDLHVYASDNAMASCSADHRLFLKPDPDAQAPHDAIASRPADHLCSQSGTSSYEVHNVSGIRKPGLDGYAPHDTMAFRCADRHSSPSGRLKYVLHSEMRGNDLVYLDVKELAQDLEPSKRQQASNATKGAYTGNAQHKNFKLTKGHQAKSSQASAQPLHLEFDVHDRSLNHTLQFRSAAQQLGGRDEQDEVVQAARTQTAYARGLEHALDGDLRGLQQEIQDLTRDLEIVRDGLQNTPRLGFRCNPTVDRRCFTPRM